MKGTSKFDLVTGSCGVVVSMLTQKARDVGSILVSSSTKFSILDSMAGVYNLACIWERKKLCHSFGNAGDLLLAVCMLVQEMADMLFHLGLTFGSPCTERSLVMGPLVLLIS